jgi:hypothetical protein
MTKRILSLILVLALLLPAIPMGARAAGLTPLIILTESDIDDPVLTYTDGYDLYFSDEDLRQLSYYFEYENDGKNATYTRGSKVVIINLKKGTFNVTLGGVPRWDKPAELPMEKINGVWYFSGLTLLPWLNVSVSEEGGKLVVIPDEYSFWDIYGELDLEEYSVTYGDLVRQYAWNSKVVKAMDYFTNSTGQALQEKLGYEDEFDASAEDYFDIFEWYLLDTSHTEYTADFLGEFAGLGSDVFGLFTLDELISISELFDIFDAFDDGLVFAAHYYAYVTQHADRMQTIQSILTNKFNGDYTPQLIKGAQYADVAYSNFLDGLLTTFYLNLDEALAGLLMDKIGDLLVDNPFADAVLLALDINTKEIKNLNRRIELMPPLYNLYNTGRQVYETNICQTVSDMTDMRCHAILSLFAAAENCRTLATYSEKHKLYDLAKQYNRQAEKCDDWIAELNACALSQVNDSISYRNGSSWETSKRRYEYDLADIFKSLTQFEPPAEGLEVVEYGMFLAYIRELSLTSVQWKILSADDENPYHRLLVEGTAKYGGKERYFMYDMDAGILRSYFSTYDQEADLSYDNPELTDSLIPGKTDALMEKLDDYLPYRDGYCWAGTADLNGDGKEDRLYVIRSSASVWVDAMYVRSDDRDFQKSLFPKDQKDTLVLAESDADGIRLRIMRLDQTDSYQLSSEGFLTAGSHTYAYQPEGEPFREEGRYLLDYCTADYSTIYAAFQINSYTNPDIYGNGGNVWNCTCMLGEPLSLVFDFASDYEDPDATPLYVQIDDLLYWSGESTGAELCPGLNMGMTYRQAAKALDLTELSYAPEQRWTDWVYLCYGGAAGCALELFFVGSSKDSAILVSVNATPTG